MSWNNISAWLIGAGLVIFLISFLFDPDQTDWLVWTDAVAATLVVIGILCAIGSMVQALRFGG